MPRLIHLNGPAGVGKSTVAQLYVDHHPGALNLDGDQIVSQIGGWRANFWETVRAANLLAASMARTHLLQGKDVIWPQVASQVQEVEGMEEAAREAGGEYHEFMLTIDKEESLARFAGRSISSRVPATQRGIDSIIADHGGPEFLARVYDHVHEFLTTRSNCIVINTAGMSPRQTYETLEETLAARR
jgi:adenylate kinase family enzyme